MRCDKEDKNDNLRFMGWMFAVISTAVGIADYFEGPSGYLLMSAILFVVGCVMIWRFRNPNGETLWEKLKAY